MKCLGKQRAICVFSLIIYPTVLSVFKWLSRAKTMKLHRLRVLAGKIVVGNREKMYLCLRKQPKTYHERQRNYHPHL